MKKVLMMDSRTFNRMTTPKDKVLTSIEGEMSNILNDESIPEDVKAKLYSSAQSRFLKIEHPQWGETTAVTKTLNSPDFVLDTLPQKLVERAKPLTSILKNTNRVSINDKNELLIDGDVIPGSNATELYLDILKKRPNTSSGYDRFEQLLQESGTPSDILEKALYKTFERVVACTTRFQRRFQPTFCIHNTRISKYQEEENKVWDLFK